MRDTVRHKRDDVPFPTPFPRVAPPVLPRGTHLALTAAVSRLRLMMVLALALVACSPDDDAEVGSRTTARLQECGLLSAGEQPALPFYLPNGCYDRCFAGGTCAELEGLLCGTSIDVGLRCDQRCAFRCFDGVLLRLDAECNGSPECAGGEDELECPSPPVEPQCRFAIRCDGVAQCASGFDEEGCVPFVCETSGMEIAEIFRCDGWPACPDMSDEAGCAQLTLMCE